MPELPEVETLARQLAPILEGRRLLAAHVLDPRLGDVGERLPVGAVVRRVRRAGKELRLTLETPAGASIHVRVHLRMTGRLLWHPAGAAPAPGERPPRARLLFEGSELRFEDVRRLGTLRIENPPEESRAPEPLDPLDRRFTPRALAALLARCRQPIKPWLMRQDRLAGVGNIYAAEALHAAGIAPWRPAGSLSPGEAARLCRALRRVLQRAIADGGTTFDDYRDSRGQPGRHQHRLRVYGRVGRPCPRCGRAIARLTQAGRSTYYCPGCQR